MVDMQQSMVSYRHVVDMFLSNPEVSLFCKNCLFLDTYTGGFRPMFDPTEVSIDVKVLVNIIIMDYKLNLIS